MLNSLTFISYHISVENIFVTVALEQLILCNLFLLLQLCYVIQYIKIFQYFLMSQLNRIGVLSIFMPKVLVDYNEASTISHQIKEHPSISRPPKKKKNDSLRLDSKVTFDNIVISRPKRTEKAWNVPNSFSSSGRKEKTEKHL